MPVPAGGLGRRRQNNPGRHLPGPSLLLIAMDGCAPTAHRPFERGHNLIMKISDVATASSRARGGVVCQLSIDAFTRLATLSDAIQKYGMLSTNLSWRDKWKPTRCLYSGVFLGGRKYNEGVYSIWDQSHM